ncbi:hypothetical protein N7448_010660 [Penicillium atrosanguineum]|nr:hypothetical protein N7448_010660 [Penicillium atrosanguineum]
MAVHCIARRIGVSLAASELCRFKGNLRNHWRYPNRTEQHYRRNYDSWTAFFREFLDAGVDMSQIAGKMTPNASFLEGYLQWWALRAVNLAPPWRQALCTWLQYLRDAGVNPGSFSSKYNQMEEEIWKSDEIAEVRQMLKYNFRPFMDLKHIDYSWKEVEGYAGDFWEMEERPIELMPGAWPDEVHGGN